MKNNQTQQLLSNVNLNLNLFSDLIIVSDIVKDLNMIKRGLSRLGKNAIMRSGISQNHNLTQIGCRFKTILSAIDGTNYGYLALEESFTMSNAGDEIIGYHIPLDSYQFAYEHLVFQPGIPLSEDQQKAYEEQKGQFIKQIEKRVEEIKSKSIKKDVEFICKL